MKLRGQAQPQKNHLTTIHQTLHLAQCSQESTILLATAKNRLIHRFSRQMSVIHHSREHVSTALESIGSMLYTTAFNALHCTCCCKAWMELLGNKNPFHHEALFALFLKGHCVGIAAID